MKTVFHIHVVLFLAYQIISTRIPYLQVFVHKISSLLIYLEKRQNARLTHDTIYNHMHELAYDLGDFVKLIKTYQDLVVVCGYSMVLNSCKHYLILHNYSHDTTFQLVTCHHFSFMRVPPHSTRTLRLPGTILRAERNYEAGRRVTYDRQFR